MVKPAALSVVSAPSRRDVRKFVALPYRLYRDDPERLQTGATSSTREAR
jgi:hypothetical protein